MELKETLFIKYSQNCFDQLKRSLITPSPVSLQNNTTAFLLYREIAKKGATKDSGCKDYYSRGPLANRLCYFFNVVVFYLTLLLRVYFPFKPHLVFSFSLGSL